MKSKLFIVFTMVVLFISGCRSSEKKEEVVQDANNYAEYNEELETTSSNTVLSDDLLYREYSLGENFNAGEILISKETLLDITKNPDSVIVYFNDEMLETFFKDTCMQLAPAGSTPMTLIFGFSSFASVETPVASPPPPIGTKM